MDRRINDKAIRLINETRVMTLAASDNDIPWSSPVYFVFHDNGFYFFSNENSRHIGYAKNQKPVSASVFHDSDHIDQIFGFQMSGALEKVTENTLYLTIARKYIAKFSFLKQVFGPQVIENRHFFLERFKSHLYCFVPDKVFLSDNAQAQNTRSMVDLSKLS